MLSLKLVRSLVLRETVQDPLRLIKEKLIQSNNKRSHEEEEGGEEEKKEASAAHRPCLIFLPTHEIIHETYKLAVIARDMGMNFSPDHSLSTIIFSCPSRPNKPLISLPFPSLSSAPLPHLRRFVRFSKGLFKLASRTPAPHAGRTRSLSLCSRVTRHRVEDIHAFSRVLTSNGWSLFKANSNINGGSRSSLSSSLSDGFDVGCCYVFRKVEASRVRGGWWRLKGVDENVDFERVRELRLPALDFRNAPPGVLHYVLLMTDDLFYLA